MKFRKLTALLLSASMAVGLLAGCGGTPSNTETGTPSTGDPGTEATGSAASGESSLKGKRVRVVIGSTSTGGDSYMIADMVTRYLGEEMGFNGKGDAIGNAQALDTISKAKGDGTTIMMFHDMAFLSVLFGAVSEDYALENLTVGPRIGVNPGGCFVAKADAPYNNLNEAAQWLADNPGEELRLRLPPGLCGVVYVGSGAVRRRGGQPHQGPGGRHHRREEAAPLGRQHRHHLRRLLLLRGVHQGGRGRPAGHEAL